MQMETVTEVNGSMIKLMGVVPTNTWTGHSILVTGKKINKAVTELRHGLMQPSMRATTNMAKSRELARSGGPMALVT